MILSTSRITKYFADNPIIREATFYLNEKEKTALIGGNGTGKTTLLRILTGELSSDSGSVTMAKGFSYGYLPQQQTYHSDQTIYHELLAGKQDILELDKQLRSLELDMKHSDGNALEGKLARYSKLTEEFEKKDGYAYKSQVIGVINGLQFTGSDRNKPINQLSGGQKTRVALGKLLLNMPDLLILDEPTNHLDLESVRWLETYLKNYKGSVLVVSHDRYFIDRIADKILELEAGFIHTFMGNYTDYAKKKEEIRNARRRQYTNQQKEIRHQEEVIAKLRSFNREKSIKRAESRVKLLNKMERLDKPVSESKNMNMAFTPGIISGNDVLTTDGLSKQFGSLLLFKDVSFALKRGEKAAVLGANGTGKTTLLKILAGQMKPETGTFRLGTNVRVGYYDQEHQVLSDDKTIFEEIQDEYPSLNHTKIRNLLAAFLFTGDDVYKNIRLLSGGEKGRVSLAKLMLSEANFLLLDEPTNHLDIESKEILEKALQNYEGTVLYVSHDRYFIDKTADRILDLTGKKLISYIGGYQYYLEKKETQEAIHQVSDPSGDRTLTESASKADWKEEKARQAAKRKLENEFAGCEEAIAGLEFKIAGLEKDLSADENARDAGKLLEISNEKEAAEKELKEKMQVWEKLAEEVLG